MSSLNDENYVFTKDDEKNMLRQELEQYEAEIGKLAPDEEKQLERWVARGISVYENPYDYYDDDGAPMDFIATARIGDIRAPGGADGVIDCDSRNGCFPDADFSTRRRRRAAVKRTVALLSAIRDAEQKYLDNVPENFQNSSSYEAGEYAVDTFEEILDLLSQVY